MKYHPFLIKPNNHELGEMFNVELKRKEDIIIYAKKLQALGAQHVLVSMAGDGAILVTKDGKVYETMPPKGKVVNSVGAGDSMVAGFITGYLNTKDMEKHSVWVWRQEALRHSVRGSLQEMRLLHFLENRQKCIIYKIKWEE